MRLVLDTDVLLSGLRSPSGASRALLVAGWQGAVVPLAGVGMFVEYEAVLKRPQHLAETGLDATEIDAFLDAWAAVVEPVASPRSHRPSIRHPSDEMFVEVALNGAADALVTFNVRDYGPSDPRLHTIGVEVCRPSDVLRRMRWRPAPDTRSAFRLR